MKIYMKTFLLALILLISSDAYSQAGRGGDGKEPVVEAVAFASLGTCASGNRGQTKQLTDLNKGTRTCTLTGGSAYSWIDNDAGVYVVSRFATGGAGTSDSPWTGWDTAITWAADTTYKFSAGEYFAYSTSPNFALDGIRLIGEAGSVLKHTGSGVGFKMDGGALAANYKQNIYVENLNILGNSSTTYGAWIKHTVRATFDRLRISGASSEAIRCEHCVLNVFNDPIVSSNVAAFPSGATPTKGMVFTNSSTDGGAATATMCTANTVINSILEGISGAGIYLDYSDTVTFLQGTSEANGTGIQTTANSKNNVLKQLHLEANTTGATLDGSRNRLEQIQSGDAFTIEATANNVQIIGGIITANVTVTAGAYECVIEDLMQGDNLLTDGGTGTRLWHNRYTPGGGAWAYRDSQIKNNLKFFNTTEIVTPYSAGYYIGSGTSGEWLTYRTGDGKLYTRDLANSRMLLTLTPGASDTTAQFQVNANTANLGFTDFYNPLRSGTAGATNIGTSAKPFGYIYFSGGSGTPATNNFVLAGTSTSGTRTITFPDASITVARSDAPQTFTGIQTFTDGVIIGSTGTATAVAGAATLNTQTGIITSEALTTASGAAYALTITNSKVTASSIVTASVQNGTNSVDNYYVQRITPGSGSVTIVVYNNSGGALNGTIKVSFIVM